MNNLISYLQKWTPLSVTFIISIVFSCLVIGWYIYKGQVPPMWAITLLSAVGSVSGAAGLISHGVNVANNSTNTTVDAISKIITNGNGNGNQDVKH